MQAKKLIAVTSVLFAGAVLFTGCIKQTPTTPTQPGSTDSTTTTTSVNLKQGLLLYLPFNGNFADSSGNGNPVEGDSATSLSYDEHGYANQAFGAYGSGALYVTNNGSIKFDTAVSISLDFMLLNNSPLQCLLSMTNPVTGYGPSYSMGITSPNLNRFSFGTVDASAGCDYFALPNGANISDTTSFVPAIGSWYNVVCIGSRGTISTYVNGKLISTKAGTGTQLNLCPSSKVVVGGWWQGGPEPVYGRIDEVRMYDRILNADEIAELSKDFQD